MSGLIGFVKTFQLEYPDIVVKYLYAEDDDQIGIEMLVDGNYIKYENNILQPPPKECPVVTNL